MKLFYRDGDMFKFERLIFVPALLLIAACSLSTTPYATSNHTIYKKVAQQSEPIQVQQTTNQVTVKTNVVDMQTMPKQNYDEPIAGSEKIIMRADSILNSEKSCHKMMTLGLAISQDYNQAITSLKNRALLIGGNAIAVLKLYEDHDAFASATTSIEVQSSDENAAASNVSGIVANIYQCL